MSKDIYTDEKFEEERLLPMLKNISNSCRVQKFKSPHYFATIKIQIAHTEISICHNCNVYFQKLMVNAANFYFKPTTNEN